MSINTTPKKIVLSFDVEDWFTVRNMREHFEFSDWDRLEQRLPIGLNFILDELDKIKTKATFFVLGWIAERDPQLVKSIADRGHEVASHGYSHTPIDLLSPESFEEDLVKSLEAITSATGKKVKGFRAPSFSITNETFWALEILKRNGIEYDSSIFSITHPDYGIKNFPVKPVDIDGLLEIPMRKGKLFGAEIPVCGGGYFRMLPYSLIKSTLKQSLIDEPMVMYFHPWEFDHEQPKIKLGALKKYRHYVGLKSNRDKFRKLLQDFEFMTMESLVSSL